MARVSRIARAVLWYAALSGLAVAMLLPFLWSVSISLKSDGAVFEYPPRLVPRAREQFARVGGERLRVKVLREDPATGTVRVKTVEPGSERRVLDLPAADVETVDRLDLRLENYPRSWRAYPFVSFWRAYLNSIAVALIVTAGHVATSSLAAFAFARLHFRGRDLLFFLYLATMMVPGAVTMIPTFVLLSALPEGLRAALGTDYFSRELLVGGTVLGIDSYFALIVPRFFSAYGTFLLRQFFLSVPKELEEAARLDGCSTFGVYWRVVLPLCRPALATLAVFTFMWAWGDFLWPLLVVSSDEIKTLPLLLASFQGQYATRWNLLMAASITALAPMLIVFLLGQRYFIEGIKLGAVKG